MGVLPHNQVLQGIQHHRTQGVTQMELELELVVDLGLAVGLVVVLVQRLVLESGILGEVVQGTVAQETDQGTAWVVVLGLVV